MTEQDTPPASPPVGGSGIFSQAVEVVTKGIRVFWLRIILVLMIAAVVASYWFVLRGADHVRPYQMSGKVVECLQTDPQKNCDYENTLVRNEYLNVARDFSFNERDIFLLEHQREVFAGQLSATRVIMRLSIAVTIVGVVLVLMQFFLALWRGDEFNDSALEVGPQGVKLNTSFIGFLMIGFALAFWLAFLEHVYQIQPLEITDTDQAASEEATEEEAPEPT